VAVTYPVSFNTCFAAFTQSTQTTSNDSYNNGTKVISKGAASMTLQNNEQGGNIYWFAVGI